MVTAAADQRSCKRLRILRLSTPIKPKLTTPNSWPRSRTRKSKSQVRRQPESVVEEQFFQDIVIAILVSGRIDGGRPRRRCAGGRHDATRTGGLASVRTW